MKQWDLFYVVLGIECYIPGRRIYWKRKILKRDVNLSVKLPKCWLINSGKKVFHSTLLLLGFSISTTLMTRHSMTRLLITKHDTVIKIWTLTPSLPCERMSGGLGRRNSTFHCGNSTSKRCCFMWTVWRQN